MPNPPQDSKPDVIDKGSPRLSISTPEVKNAAMTAVFGGTALAVMYFVNWLMSQDLSSWGPAGVIFLAFAPAIIQLAQKYTFNTKKTLVILLALTLITSQAIAQAPIPAPIPQGPVITLPQIVAGDVGAFIQVVADTNGKEVKWISLTPGLNIIPQDKLIDHHCTIVCSPQPGQYILLAYTALGDMPSDPASVSINIQAPIPPPNPDPQPTPTPVPPTPVAKHLWLITVENSLNRSQAMAALITNSSYWQGLKDKGHKPFHFTDLTDPKATSFQALVNKAGGVPCLIVMDVDSGKALDALPIPTTVSTSFVDAVVTKYTGAK